MVTHNLGLPSRALTKAASDLGRHRRWMQDRGNSLEGYMEYYKPRFDNGRKIKPEDIPAIYQKDLAILAELTANYDRLQAERSKNKN